MNKLPPTGPQFTVEHRCGILEEAVSNILRVIRQPEMPPNKPPLLAVVVSHGVKLHCDYVMVGGVINRATTVDLIIWMQEPTESQRFAIKQVSSPTCVDVKAYLHME